MSENNETNHVERLHPESGSELVVREHIGRYEFAGRFAANKSVLDAACGAGYGARILSAARATSYVGVDISQEAISYATARYSGPNIQFMVGDATRLEGIDDASIDLCTSFETIEHVDDPDAVLATIRRVLRPGGMVLLSTPNREISNPSGTLASTPPNRFHVREWTLREFTALVQGYFRIESVMGQGQIIVPKVLLRRAAVVPRLRFIKPAYELARSVRARLSRTVRGAEGSPIPVVPLTRWTRPAFIVCVCSKPQ